MLFTYLLLLGFIFLFAPPKLTDPFRLAFARLFRWPLGIGRAVSLASAGARGSEEVVSMREYSRLRNELVNVIEQRDQEHKKVEELSRLRVNSDWDRMNLVLADIITVSEGRQNELIINRGRNDGLVDGQFVLGDKSVIGIVSGASSETARVRLLTAASRVAVKIVERRGQRLRAIADGFMEGAGNNRAKIPLCSKKLAIEEGNLVFVSKQNKFLDVPIIAGRVSQCKTDEKEPVLWDIAVEPVCDIEKLRQVTVIVTNPKQ
jgi:cell shape-determining protein MreC